MFRRKPSFNLHVLISKEDNVWLAHCLELDIVAVDADQEVVKKDIVSLVRAQIESAYEHGNVANIFRPAPAEDWAKLYSASKVCDVKKLKKQDHSPINGVELCLA